MAQPNPTRSMRARLWGLRLVGTLFSIALLVWLDVSGALPMERVWSAFSSADPGLVALSIGLYVPFLVVKAARWRLLSADMMMPISWADSWRIYSIGLAAGTFTPGQAGDALKAWYLQRAGYPLGRGLGSSVLDRLFDVAGLVALGLLGVAVYGGRFAGQTPALVAWVVLGVLVVVFLAWKPSRTWVVSFISRRLTRLGLVGQQGDSTPAWTLKPTTIATASALTIGSFATSIFRVWLLAAAVGVWLGPLEVSGFVGLTTAAALVPVSVGGIGTRDAVAALAFTQLGHSAAEGIAVSLLLLLLNAAQAVAGWLVWLTYRPATQAQGAIRQPEVT
ncbi:MAG: lysylphosphatidylglycerol synthase transmembrane domain-containing protein [Chloroflexia bacterium]